LIRDYREEAAHLHRIRGRAVALPTARAFYAGRLEPLCRFEEFDTDNPLNRVLKAAIASVVASPLLDDVLRRRAARVLGEFAGLGELGTSDLMARPDRRTAYYHDAWVLSKLVLEGQGVATEVGQSPAWTFLLRTPELVEAGVRNLLQEALLPTWHLEKKGKQVVGAAITLNPDLVFEHGRLVGDVKYKVFDRWLQNDLYQAISFATGYQALGALVVSFSTGSSVSALPDLLVGTLPVKSLVWRAHNTATPDEARQHLVDEVKTWLQRSLNSAAEVALR
jgi:5-methylcytosine-specific restriction endonuclease McrBC regulatory subunit McrC